MAIDCVLLDLDGVVRHFDPERPRAIERRHGLAEGALIEVAMADGLIDDVVTGRITRAKWMAEVGRRVGAPAAATEWLTNTGTANLGTTDPEMLALADELRASGITVAILTNGTDTIPKEMEELGINRHVDAVFNTANIGVAKPDQGAFRYVCDSLQIDPASVYFTDDTSSKLGGAIELGMTAELFVDTATLRRRLSNLGVLASAS